MRRELVLVTGASGFIALHCIVQLLRAGYRVRGTVRAPARAEAVRRVLASHVDALDALELVAADLTEDRGWPEALARVDRVLHVASPLPKQATSDAGPLIAAARGGTLRVLQAAAAAGVRRVVMTSSTTAVLYGHARDGSRVYDENDWTDLSQPGIPAYEQSKTLAERAAWDFVASSPRRIELCTINPGVVLGPLLGPEFATSAELVRKLLSRELPGCPNVGWAVVDVRDVADAHLAALTCPDAPGKRFIVAIEHASMLDVARVLHEHFGARGFPVRLNSVPDWVLRLVSLWDGTAKLAVPELGKRQDVSSRLARELLGWRPRPLREMVVAMAESLIERGIVAPTRPGAVVRAQRAAAAPRAARS